MHTLGPMEPLAKSPRRSSWPGVIGDGTGAFSFGHLLGSKTAGASVSSSMMSVPIWPANNAEAASCTMPRVAAQSYQTHSTVVQKIEAQQESAQICCHDLVNCIPRADTFFP